MNIDKEARRQFYSKIKDELVHELLTCLTDNYSQLKGREKDLIDLLQSNKFRFKSYRTSKKQIKWLLKIVDRFDYKLRDWTWWDKMRSKYGR